MNPKLTQIEAKLKDWRLTDPSSDRIVDAISTLVFAHDFYREIWDESILLGLGEFMQIHPPDREFYGSKVQAINQRTAEVVAINNLFFSVLNGEPERSANALEQVAHCFDVSNQLSGIQGNLRTIIGSNTEPTTRIEQLVCELSTQLPALSGPLGGCFEAVQARQAIGMVNALLVTESAGTGVVLSVRSKVQAGSGKVQSGVATEDSFSSAVRRAQAALQSKGWLNPSHDIIYTVENTDATYVGSSISLPSAMAIYSSARGWQFDPYTGFTGNIDLRDSQWRIVRVEGIPQKLVAARRAGIRRVVIPAENKNDVPDGFDDLCLVFVDEVREVLANLTLPQRQQAETLQQRKILLVDGHCSARGWQVSAAREIQHGLQFTIAPPTAADLTISVYDSGAHSPKQHHSLEFQDLLQKLCGLDTPDTPLQNVQKVFNIRDTVLRQQIKEQLEVNGPSQSKTEQYCDYSFVFENGKERLIAKQYSAGKLQLQGHAGPLYRKTLEVIVPLYNLHYPNATLNIADYLASETPPIELTSTVNATADLVALPHIGTDESGKGDYFGPLVIAGVWVDDALQKSLAELGVRDSKKLSDRRCQELAAKIRELYQGRFYVVEISPERYNQLHDQFLQEKKNLNHLLAWGHARTIESLLGRQSCDQAIADQFGDEKYIASKLMEKGKTLKLLQTPKAERFVAVAAASILARDHFLSRLGQLSSEAGVALPKGASPAVIEAAKEIVKKRGPEALRRFAKLHFKTTASVLAR